MILLLLELINLLKKNSQNRVFRFNEKKNYFKIKAKSSSLDTNCNS